jgi:hypothetical protein
LYAQPPDLRRPLICFDESSTQLIGHVREARPAAPSIPARIDYEYVRMGMANLFVHYDVHAGWRHVAVTDQRTSCQFAHQIKDLVDRHYPQAECIRIVLDKLSTHTAAALYDTFEPGEARQLAQYGRDRDWRAQQQCLARRIAEREKLEPEIALCQARRNQAAARIQWMFTTERAREKLSHVYRPLAIIRQERQRNKRSDKVFKSRETSY